MKNQLIKIGTFLMIVLLMSSCTERKAKNFLSSFADVVQSGQIVFLPTMYPLINTNTNENISFNLTALKDQGLKATKEKEADGIGFIASDGTKIVVAKGADKNFYISSSYGLVNIDPKYKDFALKTGWIENGSNDVEILGKLSDKAFIQWASADFVKNIKKNVYARATPGGRIEEDENTGEIFYERVDLIVTNWSDYPLPAEAYNAVIRNWWGGAPESGISQDPAISLPVNAKGTATLLSLRNVSGRYEYQAVITFNENVLSDVFLENYIPTGNEYSQYMAAKNN